MEAYAEYVYGIASFVILTLTVLYVLLFLGRSRRIKGVAPGSMPKQDYSDKAYRLNWVYLNCIETLPAFLTVIIAAILRGVSPFWMNLLTTIVVVARLETLVIGVDVVYMRGIGQSNGGLCSILFVVGCTGTIAMGVMTLAAAF